jgi:hypothetical protein
MSYPATNFETVLSTFPPVLDALRAIARVFIAFPDFPWTLDMNSTNSYAFELPVSHSPAARLLPWLDRHNEDALVTDIGWVYSMVFLQTERQRKKTSSFLMSRSASANIPDNFPDGSLAILHCIS